MISRRDKQKVKKANQASLLSVENSHNSNSKKIIEVMDRWVKVRVTTDSGAAGHVMPEGMFPLVKFERKTSPKIFVAAIGEQITDLGEKTGPFTTNEGIQRCVTFRSASVVEPLISMQKVVRVGNLVVLTEKNPHLRNIRDGTMIKMDVNGVYTMDMCGLASMKQVQLWLARTASGQTAFDKPARPAASCGGENAENRKLEGVEGTEFNGVGEGEDGLADDSK